MNERNKIFITIITKIIKLSLRAMIYIIIALIKSFINRLRNICLTKTMKINEKIIIIIIIIAFIITILLLSYKLDIRFFVLLLLFIKDQILEDLKKLKDQLRIKSLNQKHKRLINMFDNNITIVNIDKEKITIFSNVLTMSEIEKSINKFELYFNKRILHVKRHSKNLRYNDIVFMTKTKFKKYYKLEEYINKINEEKINNCEIPIILGIDQNENILVKDLAEIKMLFIAGESGNGKSVLLNCIIQTLMIFSFNCYLFVDLKQGIELSDYINFKNSIIASNIEEFKRSIKVIKEIMIKRLQLIKNTSNCKNIQAYNLKSHTENMQNIIIIIDEIAEIKLNSKKSTQRSDAENDLLQILQQGRASGIYVIAATQRPSVAQIDSDIRAGFLSSISFNVKTKETQKMTKIQGTENLKTGEFKTNLETKDTIFKSFLILDEENIKKKLPKCNKIYESLEDILIKNNFHIEIKEKKVKPENRNLLQKLKDKLNKSYDKKLSHTISYHNYIKPIPNTVIEQVKSIKKLSQINEKVLENDTFIDCNNYKKFLIFIWRNKKENGLIPSSEKIKKELFLTDRKKIELLKKAENDNYIKKRSKTNFEINLSFAGWEKIKEA